MLWYSLEVPHGGTSNECPQRMLSWINKKNINILPLKKVPYLKLWYSGSKMNTPTCYDNTKVITVSI